jgi:hypothetical protein
MHARVSVLMNRIGVRARNAHGEPCFFSAFPYGGSRRRFTRFQASAREFPVSGQRTVQGAAPDQKVVIPFHDGDGNGADFPNQVTRPPPASHGFRQFHRAGIYDGLS